MISLAMKRLLLPITFLSLLGACASRTEIQSHWTANDKVAQGYEHIFVLVMTPEKTISKWIEESIDEHLLALGVTTTQARSLLTVNDLASPDARERVTAAVRNSGADAVMVASYLKTESREDYIPPQMTPGPVIVTSPISAYPVLINYHYESLYTPGYYQTNKEYYVQITVYDVGSTEPVWKAQSVTLNPLSAESGVNDFAKALATRLRRDGVIQRR
ncbi:MAG: hypothetical protein CVV10_09030 [Gammaproteobacteria bacterium HGW-Gammaproteobacteria-14]|nr:MAG: hypothetical protein CVV10_09030 [Gammaproteobacteria bacterium HGW-Gammaproteobacteria-14]